MDDSGVDTVVGVEVKGLQEFVEGKCGGFEAYSEASS